MHLGISERLHSYLLYLATGPWGCPLLGEVTPACLALLDSLSLIIVVTPVAGKTRTRSQVAGRVKVM